MMAQKNWMQSTVTKLLAALVAQNSYGSQRHNMKYYTDFEVSDNDDSEIRHHLAVNTTIVQENDLLGNLQEQRSCWNKMKRVRAYQ